jgi:hypothetical protein
VAGFDLTDLSCEAKGVGANATPGQGTGEVSITLGASATVTRTFTNEKPSAQRPAAVGGELYSVDKSALVRPYVVGLLGLLGAVATVVAITRRRRPQTPLFSL